MKLVHPLPLTVLPSVAETATAGDTIVETVLDGVLPVTIGAKCAHSVWKSTEHMDDGERLAVTALGGGVGVLGTAIVVCQSNWCCLCCCIRHIQIGWTWCQTVGSCFKTCMTPARLSAGFSFHVIHCIHFMSFIISNDVQYRVVSVSVTDDTDWCFVNTC